MFDWWWDVIVLCNGNQIMVFYVIFFEFKGYLFVDFNLLVLVCFKLCFVDYLVWMEVEGSKCQWFGDLVQFSRELKVGFIV